MANAAAQVNEMSSAEVPATEQNESPWSLSES